MFALIVPCLSPHTGGIKSHTEETHVEQTVIRDLSTEVLFIRRFPLESRFSCLPALREPTPPEDCVPFSTSVNIKNVGIFLNNHQLSFVSQIGWYFAAMVEEVVRVFLGLENQQDDSQEEFRVVVDDVDLDEFSPWETTSRKERNSIGPGVTTTLKFRLHIEDIVYSLYLFPHTDRTAADIVAVKVKNSEFHLWVQSDGALFAETTVVYFGILDTRPPPITQSETGSTSRPYQRPEVVRGGNISKFQFSRSVAGVYYLDLQVSQATVISPLDLLVGLENFFSKPVQDLLLGGPGPRKPREMPGNLRMRTNVTFTDSKLLLVSGESTNSVQAVIFSTKESSAKTIPKGQAAMSGPRSRHFAEFEIRLSGLSLSVGEYENIQLSTLTPTFVVDLVDTFDCYVHGDVVSQLDANSRQIFLLNTKFVVEPIVSRVSYQDHKLFIFVFTVGRDAFLALNNPHLKQNFYGKAADPHEPEDGQHPLRPYLLTASTDNERRSTFSTPLLTRTVLHQAHSLLQMKADFVIKGVSVKLINDCADYNVPFMDLIVSPFMIQFRDWFTPQGSLVAAPVEVAAFYFNNKLSVWEPFVEPWEFELRANALVSSGGYRGNRVSLTSKKRADVVITQTLVDIVHQALSSIRSDLNTTANQRRSARNDSSPCLIRNLTGLELEISEKSRRPNRPTVSVHFRDGEKTAWISPNDDWKNARLFTPNQPPVLSARMVMSDAAIRWETTVEDMHIGSEGEFHYLLDPDRVFPEHRRLVCHVEWNRGSKIITFRSPYVVRNTTNLKIAMQVLRKADQPQDAETVAYETVIEAGEAGAVPIHLAYNSSLRFRPVTKDEEYDWNQGLLSWQTVSAKSPTVGLVCQSRQNPEECCRFRAEFVQREEDLGDGDLGRMFPSLTLYLCTPMELENLLPCDFEYILQDNRANVITRGILARGCQASMLSVSLRSPVTLLVRVCHSNYGLSAPLVIHRPEIQESKSFTLVVENAKSGLKLELKVDAMVYPHTGESKKVRIYAPYVVVNRADSPLLYRHLRVVPETDRSPRSVTLPPVDYGSEADLDTISNVEMLSYTKLSAPILDRLSVKYPGGPWSDPIDIQAIGTRGEISLPKVGRMPARQLACKISLGKGKFNRTKIVTFSPRHEIVNSLEQDLEIQECTANGQPLLEVANLQRLNSCEGVFFHFQGLDRALRIRVPGGPWSVPFALQNLGEIYLSLLEHGQHYETAMLIGADVVMWAAGVVVTLREKTKAPIRIDNRSDFALQFYQKCTRGHIRYNANPGYSVPYLLDFPCNPERNLIIAVNESKCEVSLSNLGQRQEINFVGGSVAVTVIVEGLIRVVQVVSESVTLSPRKKRSFISSHCVSLT